MKNLRCDLSDGFYIIVKESTENQDRKRNTSYLLHLYGQGSEVKPIGTKVIPWPSNEESPTKVDYSKEDGVVKVKNAFTVAEIPLKLDKLISSRKEDNGGCKKYKSFASSIPEADSSKIISCIRSVADSPSSKTEWKKLQALLLPGTSAVPLAEQELVLSSVAHTREFKHFPDICQSILQSRILGFRKQQQFAEFCIENGQIEMIVSDLANGSYSEEIKVAVLKHITSLKQSQALPVLETVVVSGFSTERLALAGKALPPKAAAQLLEWLALLYGDFPKQEIHYQVLTMFSALLDASGSQLVLEDETQKSVTDSIEMITDYAALTDTFAKLNTGLETQDLGVKTEINELFRLRKLRLQPRKLVW